MKIGFAIAAACAIVLAGCAKAPTTTAASPAATMAAPAAPMAAAPMKAMAVTVTMNALSGSGESGTATLTAMGKKTKVDVMLKGEAKGASQPAHIHKGTCAKLNPAPAYALTNVVDGKSTTTLTEPLKELTGGMMAINVHDSAANLKKYVSCGDIKKS